MTFRSLRESLNGGPPWPPGDSEHLADHEQIHKKLNRSYLDVRADFGGVGDGTTDDTAAIMAAVAAAASTGTPVFLPAGTWLISSPIDVARGVILSGVPNLAPGGGTTIRLANGSDCSMYRTPMGASGDYADGTHFMGIKNLVFDGNGANQSVDNIAVKMWGNYVTGFCRNIVVTNNRGPAASFWFADIDLDLLWCLQTTITSGSHQAALMFGDPDTAIDPGTADVIRAGHIFVEYTANALGYSVADLQADPSKRADGLAFCRAGNISIDVFHAEGNARDVVFGEKVKQVSIGNIDSVFSDEICHFDAKPDGSVHIGQAWAPFRSATLVGSDVSSIQEITGEYLYDYWADRGGGEPSITRGLGLGPVSCDPALIQATVSVPVNVANRALFYRVTEGGTITKIGLMGGDTSSGNLQVGVYANSGSGRNSTPGAIKASSVGSAWPAIGQWTEYSLGGGDVRVEPGDWLAIACDNTTGTLASANTGSGVQANAMWSGRAAYQDSAYPLPSTASAPAGLIRLVGLMGVK